MSHSDHDIIKSVYADGLVRKRIVGSNGFSAALCKHFGLPLDQVEIGIKMHTNVDEIFGATIRLALTAEDMAGIADHMKAGQ